MFTSLHKRFLIISTLTLGLQACAGPSVEALRPVTEQNQQNIVTLSHNIQALLSLYEPLLKASGNALIYQHIAKVQSEILAVVGPPTLALKADTWEQAFEKSDRSFIGRKSNLKKRYQSTKITLQQGIDTTETDHLKRREGWVYTTVINPKFTPKVAHDLLKTLSELKRTTIAGQTHLFFQEATIRLLPFDPNLALRKKAIDGALLLLNGLREEMNLQMQILNNHSQALINYTESRIKINDTFAKLLDSTEMSNVLNMVGSKYIKDPEQLEATLNLLQDGADMFK